MAATASRGSTITGCTATGVLAPGSMSARNAPESCVAEATG
jgi:hypothetical protein